MLRAPRVIVRCRRSGPALAVSASVSCVFCVLLVTVSCATELNWRLGFAAFVLLANVLGAVSSRGEEATRRWCFALRVTLGHVLPRLPAKVRPSSAAGVQC